jgi:hypothetical protein
MNKYLPVYAVCALATAGLAGWFLSGTISLTNQSAQVIATQTAGYGSATYGGGGYGVVAADTGGSSGGGGSSSSGGGGSSRSSRNNSTDTEPDDTDEVPIETPTETQPAPVVSTVPAASGQLPVGATATDFTPRKNISFIQPEFNEVQDVQKLQRFLNAFEGESLVVDGVFDATDNEAVRRFQRKYSREILEVWNLSEPTGFVGITTRFKIQFLVNGQTAQCPVFIEFNGGLEGINVSPEVARTQELLRGLELYGGPINSTWDRNTHLAMVLFQETFREVMLDPWNITEGTGFKYMTTNKFMNYLAGCDTGSVFLEGVGEFEGI